MLGLFSSTSRIIPRAVPLLFNYWLLMSSWAHELMSSWAHHGVQARGRIHEYNVLTTSYKTSGSSFAFQFLVAPGSSAHELMSSWAHELMSNQKLKSKRTARGLIRGSKNIILVDPTPCLYPIHDELMSSWAHELMSSWAHELMSSWAHELMCSWADEQMSSSAD
jgi:hypothetical protein